MQVFPPLAIPVRAVPQGLGAPGGMTKCSGTLLSYVTSNVCFCFCHLEKGSSSCKRRPACTDKDYFYTHTACDANGEVGGTAPGPSACSLGFATLGVSVVPESGTRENPRDLHGDAGAHRGKTRWPHSFLGQTLFLPPVFATVFVPLQFHRLCFKKPFHLDFFYSLSPSGQRLPTHTCLLHLPLFLAHSLSAGSLVPPGPLLQKGLPL